MTLPLPYPTRTSRIERSCLQYLPLFWPVWQSRATVEHNDVINILGLHSKHLVTHTPISHVSLAISKLFGNEVIECYHTTDKNILICQQLAFDQLKSGHLSMLPC